MTEKAGKPSILRWHGLLGGYDSRIRLMLLAVLAVAIVAIEITGVGFIEVDLSDGLLFYLVPSLPLVALGALLFGVAYAMVLGLVAGTAMLAVSQILPQSYYELTFTTPVTSIVLMGLMGLVMGLLFALALRNNPDRLKSCLYIMLVCFVSSCLYSAIFVSAVVAYVMDLMDISVVQSVMGGQGADVAQSLALLQAYRMGDATIQSVADFVLMAAVCIIGYFAAQKLLAWRTDVGMHTMFSAWLLVVVALAFMVTASACYIFITMGELEKASESMESEVDYLCFQIENEDSRLDAMIEMFNRHGIDPLADEERLAGDNAGLYQQILADDLLSGYTVEKDGVVVVTLDGYVVESDVPEIENVRLGELTSEVTAMTQSSLDAEDVVLGVFDGVLLKQEEGLETSVADRGYEIVYVLAKVTDSEFPSTVANIMPASKVYEDRTGMMAATTLAAFVLLSVVYLLVSRLLSLSVLRRIDETNGVLARITAGDLEARVRMQDTREFKSLAEGINTTVGALKGWIAEAETRMDAELATAKSIQESALPRIFPPFPDILKFDVYASMNAAREVGGDFYDFFLIGDCDVKAGKLGFVVADVSGKGVPAALFMMEAKSQLRNYVASGMELGEAVENANHQLCEGNDAGMFVTAWVGVLDYATGHVDYVNAGHNPPLLWRYADGEAGAGEEKANRGAWGWITERSGMPLGLFDGMPYTAHSLECLPGEQFLLYSDGVTEAMDVDGKLYGEEQLEKLLGENPSSHPRALVHIVRADVARHAEGAEQSDDITILSLEVGVPPEVTATLTVPARIDQLPLVNEFIHTELDRRLCPVRTQNQLDVAVEELFVNVCHYAYRDLPVEEGAKQARVSYTYSAESPSVTVDIADDGVPYDPLAKPDAVTPDDIMEVPIGGLGILMAKQSVDEMRYRREDGSNIVTIVKRW